MFASYEEDAHWIISSSSYPWPISCWGRGRTPTPEYQKIIRETPFSSSDKRHINRINKTWRLRNALESKRLIVAYRPGDARQLGAFRGLRSRYGDELGSVFLDYMQIVPPPEDLKAASAYQRVQSVSGIIRDTAVEEDISLIAGAQINRKAMEKASSSKHLTLNHVLRPEFLREAGDLEQDANLILGLYNAVAGQREEAAADVGRFRTSLSPS